MYITIQLGVNEIHTMNLLLSLYTFNWLYVSSKIEMALNTVFHSENPACIRKNDLRNMTTKCSEVRVCVLHTK